ncbi:hypothetical protein [Aquitalea magnusonii]|uniref:hypothetical protein n=1 Tax=Aquitalea magnusonii TaxID=332411 RepID=UPI000AB54972|nr:hypothetical protein [Aquitalea magnusonii]
MRADLASLRAAGWEAAIARHLRYGGKLIGICGGLQMLGQQLHDPLGLEGEAGSSDGLGWLEMETTLATHKQLTRVSGQLTLAGAAVSGYEIHMGVSTGAALAQPAVRLEDGRCDGAISADGQILATYLHGVFDQPQSLAALLAWAGLAAPQPLDYPAIREAHIEGLADMLQQHLDLTPLAGWLP